MPGTAPIEYEVALADPRAHLYRVRCVVPDPDPDGQRVSLPAWVPGSYVIRDFARHVVSLRASCAGARLGVVKVDKSTWRCDACPGPLEVEYEVYARDASVRAAYLDTTRGFFDGASLFLQVHGREPRPCRVVLARPSQPELAGWEVASAMPAAGAAAGGFGRYGADGYEALIDHPVALGRFDRARFEACGIPHEVVLSGRQRADLERLGADLRRLCEHHVRFFGEPAPMERYTFLVRVAGTGYGGLEHRASASLACPRDGLPRPEDAHEGAPLRDAYRSFLALASHEYFHAWNVKRMRPAAFVPLDLSREAHTTLLWFFEGVTSYYEALALVRCGLVSREGYLELLAHTITRVQRAPGRFRQSVSESSFDAWTRFYKQDENAPNAIVSYYAKGALVGLALDLTLRRESAGRASLDDVMRAAWREWGSGTEGVPEDGVERLAEAVSGLDLRGFFERAVRGTGDLPLAELLAAFGVELTLRPAASPEDQGGKPVPEASGRERAVLGARVDGPEEAPRLVQVLDGGAARAAGLAAEDILVAVDGIRATRSGLERILAAYPVGATLPVHVLRGEALVAFEVTLRAAPADTAVLTVTDGVDERVAARRDAWLSGT